MASLFVLRMGQRGVMGMEGAQGTPDHRELQPAAAGKPSEAHSVPSASHDYSARPTPVVAIALRDSGEYPSAVRDRAPPVNLLHRQPQAHDEVIVVGHRRFVDEIARSGRWVGWSLFSRLADDPQSRPVQ